MDHSISGPLEEDAADEPASASLPAVSISSWFPVLEYQRERAHRHPTLLRYQFPLLPTPPHPDYDEIASTNGSTLRVSELIETLPLCPIVLHTDYTFVVCADTQFGMLEENVEWELEMSYSRQAVQAINDVRPRPLFCCVCGDLVDMTASIFTGTPHRTRPLPKSHRGESSSMWSTEECDQVQDQQYRDFRSIWSQIHPDIALVCLCGNHDVGNRPNPASIDKFRQNIGDDYFAFWTNGVYNIMLNTSLFYDPTDAMDAFNAQLQWLYERLRYARDEVKAQQIFVFGHHPWFLYDENEQPQNMSGKSIIKAQGKAIADSYFHIPWQNRNTALELFREFQVTASFAGHFHQNLVSRTSNGMEMIITSSLSMVLESTGIPKEFREPSSRGIRIVHVTAASTENGTGTFRHRFLPLP